MDNDDKDINFYVDNDPNLNILTNFSPGRNITFHGANGTEVCKISWDYGKMAFSGEMEESAKVFFEFLKPYVDGYIKAELEKGGLKPTN